MGLWRELRNTFTGGGEDRQDAKRIVLSAKNKEEAARESLENARLITDQAVTKLGQLKSEIYQETIVEFSRVYERLGKISLPELANSVEGISIESPDLDILDPKKTSIKAQELAAVSAGALAVGGTAAAGAMAAVGLFGVASTGTAIGTLSGVALTNATLAWLGGGTLAAGGAGVVGGMVVLGGIVLAPVALIAAFFGISDGKKKKDDAISFAHEVDMLVAKIETLIEALGKLRQGAHLVGSTLISLNQVVQHSIDQMRPVAERLSRKTFIGSILKKLGVDELKPAERVIVMDCVNAAFLLKQIMDKPLVSAEGAFLDEVTTSMKTVQAQVEGKKKLLGIGK